MDGDEEINEVNTKLPSLLRTYIKPISSLYIADLLKQTAALTT